MEEKKNTNPRQYLPYLSLIEKLGLLGSMGERVDIHCLRYTQREWVGNFFKGIQSFCLLPATSQYVI